MKKIYLDNAATTALDPLVLEAMLPYFSTRYGNASSLHSLGRQARKALEDARATIARSIGAKPEEIVFTGSGTEANNFVLKGLFFKHKKEKPHIITTSIEHDCILNTSRWLESQGAKITYLSVDNEGFINLEELENSITEKTLVVSIIHGNNEIGTIQNLKKIGEICKKKGVYFHTDACQSYTKTLLNVKEQNLDFATLNAHKIHGPKGVGALYIRSELKRKIDPLLHGGGHEFGLRSSTENIPGIVGFAKAVKLAKKSDIKKMEKLRDYLIKGLLEIPNVTINGPIGEARLCNNVNVAFNNIEGEALVGYLDSYGICASTGSACSSNTLKTSHVLKAIGLAPEKANTSLRISISKFTTKEEIDYFLKVLPQIVKKLRAISPL